MEVEKGTIAFLIVGVPMILIWWGFSLAMAIEVFRILSMLFYELRERRKWKQ